MIEYKKTLEILYKQKDIKMKNIEDNKELSIINSFIDQLIKIDEKIKEYIIKIQSIEKESENKKVKEISLNKNIKNKKIKDLEKIDIQEKINIIETQKSDENINDLKKNKEFTIDIEKNIIADIIKKGKSKIKIILPK